jgi:hypothetical protein
MLKNGMVAIGLLTAAAFMAVAPTATASCGGDPVPEFCYCIDTRQICRRDFGYVEVDTKNIHICVTFTHVWLC